MTASMHVDTGARALGALPADEAAAFDLCVAGCEQYAAEYAEFLATTAMLAGAVSEQPPKRLRRKVLQVAARTPQQPAPAADAPNSVLDGPSAPRGRHRRRPAWWRRVLLPLAVAVRPVVAVAVGAFGVALPQPFGVSDPSAVLPAPNGYRRQIDAQGSQIDDAGMDRPRSRHGAPAVSNGRGPIPCPSSNACWRRLRLPASQA